MQFFEVLPPVVVDRLREVAEVGRIEERVEGVQ